MEIETILKFNTAYNADCIDFCPIELFEHIFVVGTYELVNNVEKSKICDDKERVENKNERIGRLYLFSAENNEITMLQEIDMPGILDARWCTHRINDKIILGLVNANGKLIIYSLENKNHLKEIHSMCATPDLALYLDWSTVLIPNEAPLVSISDSDGHVHLYKFQNSDTELIQRIKANRFEAWVSHFNNRNCNVVYTGGDDCQFKGYDIRSLAFPIFSSKAHSAGVTSIQHSLWKETLLFSGCYNGDLNTWDTRKMRSPISTTNLGGGVWRLRCEPHCKPLMLASTMHNGFQVLEVDNKDETEIIGSYTKHESLAYGADWSRCTENFQFMVGSVSFYDKLLSLWEFSY